MRDTLFRAWDNKKHRYIYNFAVIDSCCYVETNSTDDSYVEVIKNGKSDTYYSSWATYQKVDAELEQFTGLLDMHGKKIFEGDIVSITHRYRPDYIRLSVVHEKANFCLKHKTLPYINYWLGSTGIKDLKVIGNIHEEIS